MRLNDSSEEIENLPGIVLGKVKIFFDKKLSDLHNSLFDEIAIN